MQMLFFVLNIVQKIAKYKIWYWILICAPTYVAIVYTKSNFLLLNDENAVDVFYWKKKQNKLSINALFWKM